MSPEAIKNPSGSDQLELERQYEYIDRLARLVKEREAEARRPLTACVVTFGCQMNARDSEKLRGILRAAGFSLSDDENSDVVLYNTCTVRENANNRVWGHLGILAGHKKKNPAMCIALCGCMAQEEKVRQQIAEKYPHVDLVFGTHNLHRFPELLYRALGSDDPVVEVWDQASETAEALPSERTYPFKSGVNIMYGCDNFCSYCIVPYVRGRERSRSPESILDEIKALAQQGVSEVMLLGQNVNSYGKGLDRDTSFPKLLSEVCGISGIRRVRFMTSHPKDLSEELIAVIAAEEKVARHLHLPLQSGSNRLLERMNRHYTRERYLDLARRTREAVPDIALTTDIIVGFPQETEADFSDTLSLVEEVCFDTAFTFLYSPRTGTPAASWADETPEEIKKERFLRLLTSVQTIGARQTARFTGQIREVLVEEVNRQDPALLTGRLSQNTIVHFPGDAALIGQYVPVRLSECRGFYYLGERVQ